MCDARTYITRHPSSVFAIVIDRPQSRRFHDVTPTPVWLTQHLLLVCQKGPTCVYFCVIIVSYSIFMPLIQFMCLPLWSIARESQISQCHSNTSPIDLPQKDTLFVCCLSVHYLFRIFLRCLNKKYTLINAHFLWICVLYSDRTLPFKCHFAQFLSRNAHFTNSYWSF